MPPVKLVQAAAPTLGVTPLSFEANGPDDIGRACAAIAEGRLYGTRRSPHAGGLMSHGADFDDVYRELLIDLRTARSLGIEVPRSVLVRAVQMVE